MMAKFGRLLALAQAVCLGYWLSGNVVTSQRLENAESDATRLRTYWNDFGDAPVGCEGHAEIVYKWRANDWENNFIELLLAWSRGILGGHLDIAVVLEPGNCALRAGCDDEGGAGITEGGALSPFFLPMPHLCVFDSRQDWQDFMVASGASPEVKQAALGNVDKDRDVAEDPTAKTELESGGTDLVESMTMGLDRLLSYMQPRVMDDVQAFLDAPETESFATVQYLGMHVRDVPPRMFGTFKATETLDCYESVFKFFEEKNEGARPSEIAGVWVVSEDDAALPEAKTLARRYFRNVKEENVVQIGGPALVGGLTGPGDATDAPNETEVTGENEALVHLLAQLEVLASVEVFVGAFSANLSRLVFLRREALRRPRETSVSTDKLSPFPE